jgi:3alpha(or 20beta)-hydroxysteroid dehydrogenase
MGRVDGKVALISGGSRGMGAEDARALVAEGAKVVIGDILDEEGKALADEIGDAARYVHLDVTQADQWEAAVATAVNEFGRLNVLVNNAGTVALGQIGKFDMAKWQQVIDVNLTGTFLGMQAVVEEMKKAGEGSIINVSSIEGLRGAPMVHPYVASKWAVRGLAKSAAIELGPKNIRVNSIHPGFIFTSMVRRYAGEAGLAETEARALLDPLHPLGGTGEPDDVAWGAVYLASDQAKWVTGSELVIDGGYTAR